MWIRSKNFNPIWPVRVNWWTELIYLMNQRQGSWGGFLFPSDNLKLQSCVLLLVWIMLLRRPERFAFFFFFASIERMFPKISLCISAWDKPRYSARCTWHHCQTECTKISVRRFWVCFSLCCMQTLWSRLLCWLFLFKSRPEIPCTQKCYHSPSLQFHNESWGLWAVIYFQRSGLQSKHCMPTSHSLHHCHGSYPHQQHGLPWNVPYITSPNLHI